MRLITPLLLILFFAANVASVAANQAVIMEITGKVEVQLPAGDWKPAELNMVLPAGSTISTGFNSSATIDLGTSEIHVKQLTRMTLEELMEKEGVVTTDLFLDFGEIEADVFETEGLEHDFFLKSPISTASVRGTTFIYDMFHVYVIDGIVLFFNQLNQKRRIIAGGESRTDGTSLPATVKILKEKSFWVSPTTASLTDTPGGPSPVDYGPNASGDVEIEWTY
jgi:hypothetical protein